MNQSLEEHVEGLTADIFRADQAYLLLREIGRHARQINERAFGAFFAPIQDALVRDYLLTVAKLYDSPHRGYPTRSIRVLIAIVKKSKGALKVAKSPALRNRFSRAGINVGNFDALPDARITDRLITWCESKLAPGTTVESMKVWRTWSALKFRRDKVIAHNEMLSSYATPNLQSQQVGELLELAKQIVDLVSIGYLNRFLTADDTSFFPTSDAQRSTACLKRLLANAGLIEQTHGRE
jgi:hypothetical protein